MLGRMIRKAGEVLFTGFYLVVAAVLVVSFVLLGVCFYRSDEK